MSTAWVAGNVRATALLNRRLGRVRARDIAAMKSLAEAQRALSGTAYGRGITVGQPPTETDHAVAAALLWHMRVLAGWQPRDGAQALRSLAAGFEAANITAHARALAGAPAEPLFSLGALVTAWPRLSQALSLAELRRSLSESLWGDPHGESPSDIAFGVQAAWAVRVATTVAEASSWASAGVALLVARRLLLERRELPQRLAVRLQRILGGAIGTRDLASFAHALPARSGWPLTGMTDEQQLWRGEAAWWSRVESDGLQLLATRGFRREHTIGAVAVLATDAWRCRAALQLAARGGGPIDFYDEVA